MAAGARDIRAGGAYVELSARDGLLRKSLDSAAARVKAWGAGIASAGARVATLAASGLAPFAAAASSFAEQGQSIAGMAARTGLTVEAVSELGYAARQSGASVEDLEKTILALSKQVVAAANGSDQAEEALARLGVSAEALAGMRPDRQLALIADGVARIKDPGERTAAVLAALGEAGVKLSPALEGGARGLEALREEARSLGLSTSAEQVRAAVDLGRAWGRLLDTFRAIVFQIGAAIAPALTELLDVIKGHAVSVGRWASENHGLIVSMAKGLALVAALGAGLAAAGVAVMAASAAMSVLSVAIGAVGSAIALLLSPVGQVVLGLVILGDAWVKAMDEGKAAAREIAGTWSRIAEDFRGAWGAIVEAVQAGDLEKAIKIVTASMQHLWSSAMLGLGKSWNTFIQGIGKTLQDNPWILTLAGSAGGAWAGVKIGALGGPKGAAIGGIVGGVAGGVGGFAAAMNAEEIADGLTIALADARRRVRESKAALDEAINQPTRQTQSRGGKAADNVVQAGFQALANMGSRGIFDARNASGQLGISDQVRRIVEAVEGNTDAVRRLDDTVRRAAEVK